jgi:hypothetical protein
MALTKLNARSATALDATILTGNIPALNGSAITTINASNISSGTLSAARYSGGKILQIQHMSTTTEVYYNTNNNAVETGVTDLITPSATSSKILILATIQFTNSSTSDAITWYPYRDSVSLGEQQDVRAQGVTFVSCYSYAYTDSPSSTSELEYHFKFRRTGGSGGIHAQTSGTSTSSMTLLEIGA